MQAEKERPYDRLHRILHQPIADNPRTRRYQATIDDSVASHLESARQQVERGQPVDASMVMAFCHYCPLSRFHLDPAIADYCRSWLEEWADKVLVDDMPGIASWDHTWSFGGIAYATVWLDEVLTPETKDRLHQAFAKAAPIFTNRERMGTVGNQSLSGCVGDLLYGYLLNDEKYVALSRERFDSHGPKVLMDSGQVNEQYGPCPNYSSGAFTFAFQYVFLAELTEYEERIMRALDWFRRMHTNSLYVFPGPSTRKYYPQLMRHIPLHLFGALEHAARKDPSYHSFRDRYETACGEALREHVSEANVTAILVNSRDAAGPPPEPSTRSDTGFSQFYEQSWFGRGPIKYALVHRKYQTCICFTGWLPLMGLLTWAWEDEPPIVHPLHDVPSATQAWGIDTARFPCSHLYHRNGPGCMAADVAWRPDGSSREGREDEPAFVVWRNHTLRSVAVFTDVSTVLIQSGPTGKRRTCWTLNPIEPAEPEIRSGGEIRFAERCGRLYALNGEARLCETRASARLIGQPEAELSVRQLTYEFDGGPSAFAFSGGDFQFLANDLAGQGVLEFRDRSGTFRADLSTIVDQRGGLTYGLDTATIKQTARTG